MSLDLNLKLLAGTPIKVDNGAGSINPLTLRDIIDYGYTDYLMRLNFMSLEMSDFIEDAHKLGDINLFDLLVHYGNDDMKSELENSLSLFFFEERVEIDSKEHVIRIGNGDDVRYIDRENFEKVREVIKYQNCLNKSNGEDAEEEESEAVKRIKERLNQSKEIVEQIKRQGEDEETSVDIFDILSAVSTKSTALNKLNIFDLTMFQLHDEFKRLELVEQYDIAIKSLLAGAKDVKLKHWSTKIED